MNLEENLTLPVESVLSIMQSRITRHTSYLGVKAVKSPLDFWVYQEIIYQTKPDVIVEIGTGTGGATLALAHLCDNSQGRVISMDTDQKAHEKVRNHPRITLLEGDALDLFKQIRQLIAPWEKVMVIEDSSHTYDNTLMVLRVYSSLIKSGQYFIVEDTNCHHGVNRGPSPGPYEAVETFLSESAEFESDRSKESFFITTNPKGYLRRV